ncbi:MAG: twin-arginine translocation signal domain-containing protein [Parabacteroides sp.]
MRQHSQQPEITRRDFLRRIGVAGAATTGLIA